MPPEVTSTPVPTTSPRPVSSPAPQTAAQQNSPADHGGVYSVSTPKFVGPEYLAGPSGLGYPGAKDKNGNLIPVPLRTLVTYNDGTTEFFEYDGNFPPPDPNVPWGQSRGAGPPNTPIKNAWDRTQQQNITGVRTESTGRGGRVTIMPDGTRIETQESAPVPPQIKQLTDGSFMLIFADGSSKLVTDANDQVVTDPALLAKFAHEIGLTEQQILNAVQAREIAAADLNLRSQQQGFTQQNTSTQTARQLVQDANTQTANDLANVINLAVNLPAQQAANERAAALARSNEANQRIAAAVNGETLARGAGTDAVSDAQWMLSHSAPTGFTSQLGAMQASPGLQPNFAAPGMTLPMPDLAALRRAAQGEQRQFVPDFSTALAASQAQPVAAPDLNALWNFYGNPGIRNNISLYSNQVPLPYPTDMHPYLLQNPGPYTGRVAISGAPEAAPPSLWDRQGYYTGMVGAG